MAAKTNAKSIAMLTRSTDAIQQAIHATNVKLETRDALNSRIPVLTAKIRSQTECTNATTQRIRKSRHVLSARVPIKQGAQLEPKPVMAAAHRTNSTNVMQQLRHVS